MSLPEPAADRAVHRRFAPRSSSTRTAPRRAGPPRRRVAQAIAARQQAAGRANVVFAAAPSQNEFLAGLVAHHEIDWSRVVGFHMDEYLGLDADHPASFRRYLQEHLFRLVGLGRRPAPPDPRRAGRPAARGPASTTRTLLRAEPTDIVCAGIGENGHLAFNDPPVADFLDPVLVKVVRLDAACRTQQLNDGCFDRDRGRADPRLHADGPRPAGGAGRLGGRPRPAQGRGRPGHPPRADQRVVPRLGPPPPPRRHASTSTATPRGWCSDGRLEQRRDI